MKRLSGWDAVLLYSETPNVHMHTLKVAVIELDPDSRGLDLDSFRQVIGARLNKLEPFCYQLVDIPFKLHHPMWREHCEVDLSYQIRPWRLPAPGGRRELDEAIGRIAGTPLDRDRPLWEMYFVEGLANNRVAVVGKVHHALADGVASANLMARGMDLVPTPESGPQVTDPAPTKRQLMASAFSDHFTASPEASGDHPLHRAGCRPRPTQFAQALTGTDQAVHSAADLHQSQDHPGAQVRHRDAGPRRCQRDRQAHGGDDQRRGAGHLHRGAAYLAVAL